MARLKTLRSCEPSCEQASSFGAISMVPGHRVFYTGSEKQSQPISFKLACASEKPQLSRKMSIPPSISLQLIFLCNKYMGNTMFIKDRQVCVRPMRSRIEVIQQLRSPTNVKCCRSFARMVNFVSIFCPELQKLLKPIYGLAKKSRHFIWGEEQQKASEHIKARLQKPSVLSMPGKRGRFILYSDTSKHATGSALYQVQDGSHRLIAYVNKRMPEAAKNYSITELEMCGLAINIASFAHLLKRVDFDAVVDHLAITTT